MTSSTKNTSNDSLIMDLSDAATLRKRKEASETRGNARRLYQYAEEKERAAGRKKREEEEEDRKADQSQNCANPVSYTHLTLPTKA